MRTLLIFFCTVLFATCSYTYVPPDYDSLAYDSDISNEYAFHFMNDHFEPSIRGQVDSTSKASTNAELVVINDSLNHFFVINQMRCRAWIQEDTLWVRISWSDGFTGHGVNIKIKDEKFKCIPFRSTDVIIPGRKKPIVHIEKQTLTLDKKTFQIGDSLFGRFYMRAIVDGLERKYARGHFRTRIMEGR